MPYAILGPLEVQSFGRLVEVARPRRRAVLAFLLLHANRWVSTEQLVDGLWGEEPPRTARAQIHTAVSALRSGLPDELAGGLSSEGSGYRLRVAEGDLDSAEFSRRFTAAREFAESGEKEEAARLLRSGLGLWRGDALTGLEAPFAGPARARLEEERFVAYELLADLEMSFGRHHELLPELTNLLNQYPACESIAERLTVALYRSGRQADALAVVRRLRRLLADEYGLDLGKRLVELEAAILRGTLPPQSSPQSSPQPSGPAVPVRPAPVSDSLADRELRIHRPAQLPRATAGFVGRGAELAKLGILVGSAPGDTGVALISGPAGVGKTSLALRWAHSRVGDFPDGQLFADLHGYDAVDSEVPGRVLERFLVALGVPGYEIPADMAHREDMYRSRMANRRMLVVLDNARDYQQVWSLLPGTAQCLALVTSRGKMGRLVTETGAVSIPLGLLTLEDSVEALGQIVGAPRVEAAPGAARDLARLCGGLPLALRISAVRLVEEPMIPVAVLVAELTPEEGRLAGLGLPGEDHTVSRALDHTYARLTAEQARLFRVLSLHPGASLGSAAAEAVAGRQETLGGTSSVLVRQSLRALDAVHLLDQTEHDRYSMHDLVRLYSRKVAPLSPAEEELAMDRLFDWYISASASAHEVLTPGGARVVPDLKHLSSGLSPFEDQDEALRWFDQEIEAVASLIRLAVARRDHRVVWQLSSSISTYLMRRHRLDLLVETQQLGEHAAREVGMELEAAAIAAKPGNRLLHAARSSECGPVRAGNCDLRPPR
ncbi:AfsR/SARP family transcriptional regulator [Streptomyces sp. RKAG293]|uniref:AfsR/SARP family transcriptional regulator n=1 Tax=Streptomyces sp. RKAG293 TaxID=2893403 RepID=UPI0020333132|nr:AfsR/SARP family transcriptional regulator [Streptomyces sp. RKAG293]MCM2420605.1 winged helix-turn-helix domain-containing protein [Streptomyces sp. RKAG293]